MINFFYLYINSDNLNMIIQNLYTMSNLFFLLIWLWLYQYLKLYIYYPSDGIMIIDFSTCEVT
jgi:hypothetical protein